MTGSAPGIRVRGAPGPRWRTLLGLLALAGVAEAANEFPVHGEGRPAFRVDAVALPVGADSARIELRWEISYQQLTFREDDGWYRARYDVTIVVSRGGRQVGGDVVERRVRTQSFDDTRSSRLAKGKQAIAVGVGDFDVRVSVSDRGSGFTSRARARIAAVFGPSRIGLSDLQFLRYTGEQAVPNSGRDVPVGEVGHVARIVVHAAQAKDDVFRLSWKFASRSGRGAVSGDSTIQLAGDTMPVEIPVPADQLEPGAQRLEVTLEGADGRAEETRDATFFIRLTGEWFTVHRGEALEVLESIAEGAELRTLRRAEGDEWAAAIRDYWDRHDPSPEAPGNEFREAVQERMESAATLFLEPFRRPGWRTDRGKIFIQFGRPDRRTVRPGGFDAPASELWEYDFPRRVFFFVDQRGTGEFWLRG